MKSADQKRPLKVFLCHAHADRDPVRALYTRLTKDGVDAWLDKEKLLPGQDWELEIKKAVRAADVVVVCLSKQFNQAGFRQKEVRLALGTAMEKPEGEIFIIPARLEECDNLESLRKWHEVDLFEDDGYEILMRAFHARAEKVGAELSNIKQNAPQEPAHNTVVDHLNWMEVSHSSIFYGRMCDAFPGVRGIEKFSREEAVNRLCVLLRQPLVANISKSPSDGKITPFWWLRGRADMYVHDFQQLDLERILLDNLELHINHVAAVREFGSEKRNFVYVEAFPEEETGLYQRPKDWLRDYMKNRLEEGYGYYFFEEYGLWNDKVITRQELDDGSAIIEGKPVRITGAELRLRYLTAFNFVLCGGDHILNNEDPNNDTEFSKIMDDILMKRKTVDDLVSFVAGLPNPRRFGL